MFKVANGTISGSASGTADFTVTGFGTVAAAIVVINSANATNNPETGRTTAFYSIGFFDGANQNSHSNAGTDNAATTDVWSTQSSSLVGHFTNTSLTTVLEVSASKITDGIRLTTDKTDGAAYQAMVVLIPATGTDNVKTEVIDGSLTTAGGVLDVTSVGFEADLVFTALAKNEVDFDGGNVEGLGFGIVHNGGKLYQGCMGFHANSGRDLTATTSYSSVYVSEEYGEAAIYNSGSLLGHGSVFSNFNSSGWTMTKYTDPIGPNITVQDVQDMSYLAIKFTGSPNIAAFSETAPASTGSWQVTEAGFQPEFGFLIAPRISSTRGDIDTTDADGISLVAFDDTTQRSIMFTDADGVSNNALIGAGSSSGLDVRQDDQAVAYAGSFTSFDAGGWTWNMSTVQAGGDPWIALAIGGASTTANEFFYTKSHPWATQPPAGTQISRGNSIAEGLSYAYNFKGGPEAQADVVRQIKPNSIDMLTRTDTDGRFGPLHHMETPGTAGDIWDSNFDPNAGLTKPISGIMLCRVSSTINGPFLSHRDGANINCFFYGNGLGRLFFAKGAGTGNIVDYFTPVSDEWFVFGFSCSDLSSTGDCRIFRDGTFVQNLNVGSDSNQASTDFTLGARWDGEPTITSPTVGDYALLALWERKLTDGEHAALGVNPWQIFEPQRKLVGAAITAAAGVVITDVANSGETPGVGSETWDDGSTGNVISGSGFV